MVPKSPFRVLSVERFDEFCFFRWLLPGNFARADVRRAADRSQQYSDLPVLSVFYISFVRLTSF